MSECFEQQEPLDHPPPPEPLSAGHQVVAGLQRTERSSVMIKLGKVSEETKGSKFFGSPEPDLRPLFPI